MNGFPFSCTHRHAEHTRQHVPAPKVKCPVKTILNLIRRTCVVLVPTHNACWVPSLHCSVLNGPIHPEVSNQSQVYDLFFFLMPQGPKWQSQGFLCEVSGDFRAFLSSSLLFSAAQRTSLSPLTPPYFYICQLQMLSSGSGNEKICGTQKLLVLEIPGPWDTSGQR